MGATTPDSLPYPEQNDEVDVPTDLGELAVAVQAALHRAVICTSSTRPSSPTDGLTIWETDTKLFKVYDLLTTSWVGTGTGGGGGGGGGGTVGGGRWSAGAVAQPIPNTASGPGTIAAFGSAVGTPSLVTRSAAGAGHRFVLGESGLWACGSTIRVASSAAGGEISAGIWADLAGGTAYDFSVSQDGGRREGLPRTLCPARTTYLPAGAAIVVFVYNGTGTTRTLEPNTGSWVNLDLWLVG